MFLSAETMALILDLDLPKDKVLALYAALERDYRAVETIPHAAGNSASDRKKAADRERIKAKRAASRTVIVAKEVAEESRDKPATPSENVAEVAATPDATPCDSPHVSDHARVVIPSLPSLRSEESLPLTLPSVASPNKPKKAKTARSRRCPESWQPSEAHEALARELGYTSAAANLQLANFRDHEFKDPKSDFDAAFRRWLRTSAPSQGATNGRRTASTDYAADRAATRREAMDAGLGQALDPGRRQRWGL